jgi:hypothetical protein
MPGRIHLTPCPLDEKLFIKKPYGRCAQDLLGMRRQSREERKVSEGIMEFPDKNIPMKAISVFPLGFFAKHRELSDCIFDGLAEFTDRIEIEKPSRTNNAILFKCG